MSPDRERLFQIASEFRSQIEACWSDESAYHVSEIVTYGVGIPGGQCAVTCLVLWDVLTREFPQYRIRLIGGSLRSSDDRVLIPRHAWLEVSDGDAMIVDPTADQCDEIREPVVLGSLKEIQERGLFYVATEIEDDHGETEHPKRFARYQILKNAFVRR